MLDLDEIDFELANTGFGYAPGQTLTIPTGGATGIPTDPTLSGTLEDSLLKLRSSLLTSSLLGLLDNFKRWTTLLMSLLVYQGLSVKNRR